MASTVVDELITLLTLEGDPDNEAQSKRFTASLKGIEDVAKKAGAALLITAGAVGAWTLKTSSAIDESGKFAESLGISFQAMQEFEFAAQRVGGSADELRGDLAMLQTQFGGFESADQTLERLSKSFDGLSNVEAQMLGRNFGLSETTIRLLQQGSDGLAQLRQEAVALGGIIPDEATKQAAEFEDQLTNIQFALLGTAKTATVAVLPALTDIAKGFTSFIVANQAKIQKFVSDFVTGFLRGFEQFSGMISTAASSLSNFTGPLGDFISAFDMADIVSSAVMATLVGLGVVLLPFAVKFAAIAAAVAAVVLAVDDLIVFLQGGESVIGNFVDSFSKEFPEIARVIGSLVDLVQLLMDHFMDLMAVRFDDLLTHWDNLAAIVKTVLKLIDMVFKGLTGLSEIAFNLPDFLTEFKDLADLKIGNFFGRVGEVTANAGATVVPANQSVMNQSSTNVQGGNNTFHIYESGNANATGQQVVDRLGLRNVQQVTNPGINAPVVG